MSLKFLAVGQSVAGIREGKSPYALRKQNQLPTFPGTARFTGKPAPVEPGPIQTDWLQPSGTVEAVPHPRPSQTQNAIIVPKPKRRWFSIFKWNWFRTTAPRADLVQTELSLEKVRVIRNDLVDSDIELVLKRKKKKAVFATHQENNNLPRTGWTELAAKLFDLGQK